MDSFKISDDIPVMCITATSFPDGVENAHQILHALFSDKEKRHIFGISHPDQSGTIIYKAAVEITQHGEAEKLGLETFHIKKGDYNCFFIKNYKDKISSIREAFEILLKQQEVDPNGYCLEWYIGENDVKCMVPVDEGHLHFTGVSKE
jgi:predicted transcriptional regulator YdeE